MSSAFAQDARPGTGCASKDEKVIKACRMLLSNAGATGSANSDEAARL